MPKAGAEAELALCWYSVQAFTLAFCFSLALLSALSSLGSEV